MKRKRNLFLFLAVLAGLWSSDLNLMADAVCMCFSKDKRVIIYNWTGVATTDCNQLTTYGNPSKCSSAGNFANLPGMTRQAYVGMPTPPPATPTPTPHPPTPTPIIIICGPGESIGCQQAPRRTPTPPPNVVHHGPTE